MILFVDFCSVSLSLSQNIVAGFLTHKIERVIFRPRKQSISYVIVIMHYGCKWFQFKWKWSTGKTSRTRRELSNWQNRHRTKKHNKIFLFYSSFHFHTLIKLGNFIPDGCEIYLNVPLLPLQQALFCVLVYAAALHTTKTHWHTHKLLSQWNDDE